MNNGETSSGEINPTVSEWDSMAESGREIQEQREHAKEFTARELDRLAEITGRTPDDEGVIALNLALRYRKYQQAKALVEKTKQDNENSKTKTMIQHGTMEDIATLKRELEEAMYLYDSRFAEMDEAQKKKEAKDSYRQYERVENGENHNEPGYWLKVYQARKARREGYNGADGEHYAGYDEKRDATAEDLADRLDDITREVEDSEVFKTYEWNKGDFPEENMRDRRDGLKGTGKNGLLVNGRYDDIDWKLYPHAPAERNGSEISSDWKEPPIPPIPPEPEPLEPGGDEKDPNKVDIDVKLKGIEQEFDDIDKERIKTLEEKLNKMLPELAELYAKNRRLLVGKDNRAEFVKVKGEYGELLRESLRLKAKETHEAGKHEIADFLGTRLEELTKEIEQKLTEFVGGDPENSNKTQEEVDAKKQELIEEAEKALRAEYGERADALKTKINADFLEDFLAHESKLEEATIDALDNGTLCRKFVNKVLNNKLLKGVLAGAAVAGLAVTGVGLAAGLAAGTMSIGFGFTAGGIATGALKGALGGTLMSRQNSKNSAVRGFASEEEIKKSLEGIDITDKNSDISNVTEYLLGQYGEANDKDRSSNRKKTLVSAGIGAAIGGIMSGVQINNVETTTSTHDEIVGYEPKITEVHAANLDQVDIPEGYGQWEMFRQLGGDPSNYKAYEEILFSFDSKYGLVPGSNGSTAGIGGLVGNFAHTYPGPINTWPDVVQSYITEVTNEAARQGLIPSNVVQIGGGNPIYNTITDTVTSIIPDAFMNFIARATAAVGIGWAGSRIGNSETASRDDKPESAPGGSSSSESAPNNPEPTPTETEAEEAPAEIPTETPTEAPLENQPEPTPEVSNETADDINERVNEKVQFMNAVEDSLGNLIGDTGVGIVSESGDYLLDLPEFNTRIENWWNTLDDESKDAVRAFERTIDNPSLGRPLRNWLSGRGEI